MMNKEFWISYILLTLITGFLLFIVEFSENKVIVFLLIFLISVIESKRQ